MNDQYVQCAGCSEWVSIYFTEEIEVANVEGQRLCKFCSLDYECSICSTLCDPDVTDVIDPVCQYCYEEERYGLEEIDDEEE